MVGRMSYTGYKAVISFNIEQARTISARMSEHYEFLFKFLVIGSAGTGKSCILHQFIDKKFKPDTKHTIGVEFLSKIVNLGGKKAKLQIWDTSGQQRFTAVTRSYYRDAAGALLVYDIASRESFNSLTKFLTDARALARPNIIIILVGNKKDLDSEREVTFLEASCFAQENELMFLETNAVTGENVEETFLKCAKTIMLKIESEDSGLTTSLAPSAAAACVTSTAESRDQTVARYSAYEELLSDSGEDEEEDADLQALIIRSLNEEVPLSSTSRMSAVLKPLCKSICGESQMILVHRRQLWRSVSMATKKESFSFFKPIKVVFTGEDAEDEGGPARELFRLLMQEVGTGHGILQGSVGHKTFTHNLALLQQGMYRSAGEYVKWSVLHGGPSLPVFSSSFVDLLFDGSCNKLDEIPYIVDVQARDALLQLSAANTETDFQQALHDAQDWILSLDWILGLSAHDIRYQNKTKFLTLLVSQELYYRYLPAIDQFREGLGQLWHVMRANRETTRSLFLWTDTKLKYIDLRKMYDIVWSHEGSNHRLAEEETIFFWETFIESLDRCEEVSITLRDILAFWTGADTTPPLGFPSRLKIQFYSQDIDCRRLPYSSTCALILWLPRNVKNEMEMRNLLTDSIQNSAGFGKI